MNRIALNEKDFISLVSNNLTINNIKINDKNLLDLISGEIIEIDDNLIILQDIGFDKIAHILDKYRKI